MAPTYKLTYFPIKGLAEPIRFLMAYGNLEYEDMRLPKEQWPQHKESMPFGQVPTLEINGKIHHQSMAIGRYLAKQVKLYGDNDLEALEIDTMGDTINDLRMKIAKVHYEPDEKAKAALLAPLKAEIIPYYMERLEKIAKANKGHLACGKLTYVDLAFAVFYDSLQAMVPFDKFPSLMAVRNNVVNLPSIKAWIAKRPQTDV